MSIISLVYYEFLQDKNITPKPPLHPTPGTFSWILLLKPFYLDMAKSKYILFGYGKIWFQNPIIRNPLLGHPGLFPN